MWLLHSGLQLNSFFDGSGSLAVVNICLQENVGHLKLMMMWMHKQAERIQITTIHREVRFLLLTVLSITLAPQGGF